MQPHTTPHFTLSVPEITIKILGELSVINLLSAALVCKDWSWKATDTRWRWHPVKLSLLLSKLAPLEDYSRDGGALDENETLNLVLRLQALSRQEWIDFRTRYAEKVTHLEVDHPFLPKYVLLFPIWTQDLGPMCPQIHTLHFLGDGEIGIEDVPTWSAALALITLPVPSLKISNWIEPDDALDWLTATRAELIQTVDIKIHDIHPTYSKFTNLTGLTLGGTISFHSWKRVALGCRELQDLHLTIGHFDRDDNDALKGQRAIFPSLINFSLAFLFRISANNQDALRMCLQKSEMPSLRSFSFHNLDLSTGYVVEVARWLQGMKALEVFKFEVVKPVRLLSIFFQLPSLAVISVQSSHGWLDASDVDLESLGQGQDRLKELCVEQSPSGSDCTHGATCTLSGFLNLAGHPYSNTLEILTISVRATHNYNFPEVFPILPSLQTLRFQHLEIDVSQEAAFATLLAKLCPNLRSLSIRCLYLRGSYQVAPSTLLEQIFWRERTRFSPPSWIHTSNLTTSSKPSLPLTTASTSRQ
ncbi:hypothetical protein FRB94_011084 [Tulasnella sp. JGI-2019a]|nr:hypothetical protein FRB93_009784 [Tulasnella sp. JGI-2019a]KAG8993052.1 hypothetical protein FRB94_011084 [Tulasnella sp. JGI-2019a]KAG9024974.1 hypothetical protein FRB95_010837 [Tulasnella sp. JGI-2019a]